MSEERRTTAAETPAGAAPVQAAPSAAAAVTGQAPVAGSLTAEVPQADGGGAITPDAQPATGGAPTTSGGPAVVSSASAASGGSASGGVATASATRIIPGLAPTTPPIGPNSASGPRTLTPKPVAWRSWPVVDSKLELIGLVVVIGAAVGILWRATESPTTAALCGLAMAFAVWRQFVPTFFELSALGLTQRTLRRTRRIPWLSIDRYVVGKRGVYLSSAGAPLESLRGLYLPWGHQRDEVLASLHYYLPRAEEVVA